MGIEFAKVKVEDCDFILKIRNDDSTRSFYMTLGSFLRRSLKSGSKVRSQIG